MTKIKIASWNVNSVKARLENLLFWLEEVKPDIALIQEIKCLEENFPFKPIEDLGYNIAAFGQKSYNGVAILSKFPLQDIIKGLPRGVENDDQSRYIEALAVVENTALRIASIYVPNGGSKLEEDQDVNQTAKFKYKMQFFDRLKSHLQNLMKHNEIAVFGGDYNVALNDIDVYDPVSLKDTICFHIDEKKKMRQILNLGYLDCFRQQNPNMNSFTWWDYRGNSWNYNKGMRIDYLLASPKAADILSESFMDEKIMERKKPSDHCPVVAVFEI
jgi:exodeoxyribonuclease-3